MSNKTHIDSMVAAAIIATRYPLTLTVPIPIEKVEELCMLQELRTELFKMFKVLGVSEEVQ